MSTGFDGCDQISHGIWSGLPESERAASYDSIARGYDLLVGNALYNRVVWGCPKPVYRIGRDGLFAGNMLFLQGRKSDEWRQ